MGLKNNYYTNYVILNQQENFRFEATFTGNGAQWITDEPVPIGTSAGPSPEQLLCAGIANCLTNSLYFAVSKYRQNPAPLNTKARSFISRNENNRLRIVRIEVEIQLGKRKDELVYLDKALSVFEDFCTVASSVGSAIPIHISVSDSQGEILRKGFHGSDC